MKRTLRWGILLGTYLSLVSPAAADQDAKPADKGKEVFAAQHCSMCHAIAGKGNPRTPLDEVGSKLTRDQMKKVITSPKEVKPDSKMTAYPNLQAADLEALVTYLSTLKKK